MRSFLLEAAVCVFIYLGFRILACRLGTSTFSVQSVSIFLLRNAGVEVEALEKRVISSVVLEAGDNDTPNNHILYILNAGPRFGILQLRVSMDK